MFLIRQHQTSAINPKTFCGRWKLHCDGLTLEGFTCVKHRSHGLLIPKHASESDSLIVSDPIADVGLMTQCGNGLGICCHRTQGSPLPIHESEVSGSLFIKRVDENKVSSNPAGFGLNGFHDIVHGTFHILNQFRAVGSFTPRPATFGDPDGQGGLTIPAERTANISDNLFNEWCMVIGVKAVIIHAVEHTVLSQVLQVMHIMATGNTRSRTSSSPAPSFRRSIAASILRRAHSLAMPLPCCGSGICRCCSQASGC